jgi:hypothetical protein
MSEEWRDVVGYEGFYQVSDAGRVRSIRRVCRDGQSRGGKLLKQSTDENGRPRVDVKVDGTHRNFKVCRLVALAFLGTPATDQEVCHGNGNAADNRLDNLRWDTHQANVDDTARHGTRLQGERIPWSKLTPGRIAGARVLIAEGNTYAAVGAILGVSAMTVWDALNGRAWNHLEIPT